jgi:UDP-N-acetylmuramoyl-tripeptide--D-alanyl-D-alanine ligase
MLRNLSLHELIEVTQGKFLTQDVSAECSHISTDTRTLSEGSLYIPLIGERFDGHAFAPDAEKAGSVAMLAERQVSASIPVICVESTLKALADIAAWHRDLFTGPVVAVTGSAGKTTVKQLMGSVLSQKFNTLITKGNLNNHIGAPLTLLSLESEHEAAMIELGASGVGEIEYTAKLVKPKVGIITNVVPVHLEGFGSVDNIASTKGELIDAIVNGGTAILNADDKYFSQWVKRAAHLNVISFGLTDSADVRAENINATINGCTFNLLIDDQRMNVSIPLPGKHNVCNALAVVAAAKAIGLTIEETLAGLNAIEPVAGRMQALEGEKGQYLINDSYNANPESFRAAIDVLALADRTWVVMGDMGELGDEAVELHSSTGKYAREKNINHFVATGPLSRAACIAYGDDAHWFRTQDELIEFLKYETGSRDTLLIKGSRSAAMDKVVAALNNKKEEC